ncbi:MAG: T9SS type A sorting domain-containing protein [Chitinophagales bacterium]|nr:T9SS type A sorting domain-containing protein [Bacteroidota bacterium]MBP7398139.1 T9SS type A sorting domain-containing protein [Chitinophagales bacterium]MBP8753125.1 T9SS type A sorting domain-containing protein [Chitinophagales bacterium]MBP9189114.1 T9SS type A sorting domain-containing protein [Chitinophagales bacterium]MBP9548153.1 T9SS type A sorting domain-containing protein [Chitinophagales bacterium]
MKNKLQLFITIISIVISIQLKAQAPLIEWQNTIGGDDGDWIYSVIQTSDSGYLLGGSSWSNISGDKTVASKGFDDYWVIKLDNTGSIQWQKTIGGSEIDLLRSVIQSNDGGYLLGGYSKSGISGDKTEANLGIADYWVVKLDNLGNIQWQNSIGGSNDDNLISVIQTSEGGYLLGGTSKSGISGDKTEGSLGDDYWVVKLDSSGNIQWQKTFGGSMVDYLYSVNQTSDGGFFLAGYSTSDISGDKTEPNSGGDYWVLKLDSIGNIEWQNTIGGSNLDVLYSATLTSDGGYFLGGYSNSNISGDKSEDGLGSYDYWVVKLDSSGNIQWQNTIGGSDVDWLYSVIQTSEGGYLLGGESRSGISGDKTEPAHYVDYWVVKLDSLGNIQWENTIGGGGVGTDVLNSVIQTSDGGYFLGGYSSSKNSIDKTEPNLGGLDYWVVKLYPETCTFPSGLMVHNITPSIIKIHWNTISGADKYQIYYRPVDDLTWIKVTSTSNTKTIKGLSPGTEYEYKVRTKCGEENTDFSSVAYFTTLPLRLGEISSGVTIYPNPASSQLTVEIENDNASEKHIEIMDALGRSVQTISTSENIVVIDISNLSAGIYFVKLQQADIITLLKFIKE